MGGSNTPEAEVDVSVPMVSSLLQRQHPDLAELEITELANGWDNVMFRLGDDLVVRLPRRSVAAKLVDHEARWLPGLGPRLPVPIPVPVRVGHATDDYPWTWTIVPWFDGTVIGADPLPNSRVVADQLGEFLAALHQPAPAEAPVNPYRGVPLTDRAEAMADRIDSLAGVIDTAKVTGAWTTALEAPPWDGPPLWIHGDLHPLNIVGDDDGVAAVIDWGDITGGDPATDLLVAWALFDEEDRAVFRAAAHTQTRPIDDAMWARARGWAVAHGLAVLAHSADAPIMQAVGLKTLAAALG